MARLHCAKRGRSSSTKPTWTTEPEWVDYSQKEIEERFVEVRQDPSKLDAIFTLPQKEIYSVPSELQRNSFSQSNSQ